MRKRSIRVLRVGMGINVGNDSIHDDFSISSCASSAPPFPITYHQRNITPRSRGERLALKDKMLLERNNLLKVTVTTSITTMII